MEPREQAQYVGEGVTMKCSTSDPIWTKDGQPLPGGTIIQGNILIIDEVTLEHTGTYICNSTPTEEGEWSSGSSNLYVGGKLFCYIWC